MYQIGRFGLASRVEAHIDQYLGIRGIFWKTDCCVMTMRKSRLFWVPWTLQMKKLTHKGVLCYFQQICGRSKKFQNQKNIFYPLYHRATFPSWQKRSNEKSVFQPPDLSRWKTTCDGTWPLMIYNLWRNMTLDGRQHSLKDTLWWKMNFDLRRSLIEEDFWWKTTFDGKDETRSP